MTIQELREKRAKIWDNARDFLDSKRNDSGLLSEEDSKTYDALEKQIVDLGNEIKRLERQEKLGAEINNPTSTPIVGKPRKTGDYTKNDKITASAEYKKAVLDAFRSNFRQISDVLQEGVDADGGYLVPDEYDSRLIDTLDEENIMRKLGTTITTSGSHKINLVASKPSAAWVEEGAELTFGDAKFGQILLDAHKLHVGVKVTEELLYDNAFNLENYLLTQFGMALANAEEDAFLNGTGTTQPTGIFDATKGGKITTISTAIKSDDLINLVYTLKRPYRKKAVFILNDKTIADSDSATSTMQKSQVGERTEIRQITPLPCESPVR